MSFKTAMDFAFVIFMLAFQVSCLEKKQSVVFGSENNPKGLAEIQDHMTVTSSRSINVLLASPDAEEVAFFIGEPCRPLNAKWGPYATVKSINLLETDGAQTIFVLFRNSLKFVSECISLPILVDRTGPTIAQAQLKYKHSQLGQTPDFDIGNVSDASSELKKIEGRVLEYADQVAITDWINFDKNTLAQKILGLALTDGKIYAVQLRATDSLDNVGPLVLTAPFQAGPSVVSQNQIFSSAGGVTYDLKLSAPSLDDFEVAYFSEANTAAEGIDFNAVNSKVIFPPGSDTATINLTLLEDLQSGPRRTFYLKTQPSQVDLATTPQAVTMTLPSSPVLTALSPLGLANLPETVDSSAALNIAVASTNVTQYRCKLFSEATDDCASYSNYGSATDIINALTDDLAQFSSGTNLTLCVTGKTNTRYLSFWKSTWLKDNLAYVYFSDSGSVMSENTAQSFTLVVSDIKPYPVAVSYVVEGTATASDHNLNSGSVTIPAGQSSASVTYNNLRNLSPNASKSLIIRLTGADHGAVEAVAVQENRINDSDGGNLNDFLYSMVSAGGESTCAITTGGKLKCWGSNSVGQLGDGTTLSKNSPVSVDDANNYNKVSVGANNSCGITATGLLKCWGSNDNGRLGIGVASGGDSLVPVAVDASETYSEILVGYSSSCGLTTQGILKCWGAKFAIYGYNYSPTAVDSSVAYKSVSVGSSHICAITTGNVLKCWGGNSNGQVGDGTTSSSTAPKVIDSGTSYISIGARANKTCGVTAANKIRCWGQNLLFSLGVSSPSQVLSPMTIDSDYSYTQLDLGDQHGCGLSTTGKIRCWGNNGNNQLADQKSQGYVPGSLPQEVISSSSFINLNAGDNHTCAIKASGRLYCWGNNNSGQLGNGTTNTRIILPRLVADNSAIYSRVDVGLFGNCAITDSKALKCWGNGGRGLLQIASPRAVDVGGEYSQFSISADHTCAITTAGILKCWGSNYYNECGPGANVQIKTPHVLDSESTYAQISAGQGYSCGITSLGALKCWGHNGNGQLGDGTIESRESPVIISGGLKYSKVATSKYGATTCAITTAGALKCWGKNYAAQVGDGTGVQRLTPVDVDRGVQYVSVTVGNAHSCGITAAGALKCWGSNLFGQVGNGTSATTVTTVPAEIDIGASYIDISAGYSDTCGITDQATLKCWGIMNGSSTPATTDSGTPYRNVNVGNSFACGVTTTGLIKCWGDSVTGGINSNSMLWIPRPVLQAAP